jgi:NADPH:quinone reductase
MRALICRDYQGIDALEVGELPDPEPGPGLVLIEVASVAVNFADTLMVSGQYQLKPEPPFAPGYEFAGTVSDAAESSRLSPGDRVCGFVPYGAMAEQVVVPSKSVDLLPGNIGFDAGATLPGTYGTSYHALVDRAHLEPGETLLVLGAAGGVGLAAVQIGKALGATVIGAVSSPEKAGLVLAAEADEVIRYDEVGLRDGIDQVTRGAGVDVVYDPVGGDLTEQALRSTRWNGRHLVVGFAAGPIPRIPLNIPLLKGSSLVGVFWGRFTSEEPVKAGLNRQQILDWVADGTLTPVVGRAFSLDDGREAFRLVADREAAGRVVINP